MLVFFSILFVSETTQRGGGTAVSESSRRCLNARSAHSRQPNPAWLLSPHIRQHTLRPCLSRIRPESHYTDAVSRSCYLRDCSALILMKECFCTTGSCVLTDHRAGSVGSVVGRTGCLTCGRWRLVGSRRWACFHTIALHFRKALVVHWSLPSFCRLVFVAKHLHPWIRLQA